MTTCPEYAYRAAHRQTGGPCHCGTCGVPPATVPGTSDVVRAGLVGEVARGFEQDCVSPGLVEPALQPWVCRLGLLRSAQPRGGGSGAVATRGGVAR
jgi:hypothetical protein